MKKAIHIYILICMMLTTAVGCKRNANAEQIPVGIAWRPDSDAYTFRSTVEAVRAAGATPILLKQVISSELSYSADGKLEQSYISELNMLRSEYAELIKAKRSYEHSNAAAEASKIRAVIFPGGADISPTLIADHAPIGESTEECDAERDVSDYLLMTYCLDQDMPILAICRGMQMLAIVSGGSMIQDIPSYFAAKGEDMPTLHRMPQSDNRDFAAHDILITDKGSLMYHIVGSETISKIPSWHHEAAVMTDTALFAVTAVVPDGTGMIEAIERKDKRFVLGVQFHPEISFLGNPEGSLKDLTDPKLSLAFFTALTDAARD